MWQGFPTERFVVGGIAFSLAVLSWTAVVLAVNAPATGVLDATTLLLFVGVWAVAMVAMMLPSLLPMIFLVVSSTKQSFVDKGNPGLARRAFGPIEFTLGYFGIWSLVGVAAYLGLTFLFRFYPPFSTLGQLAGVAAGGAVFLAGVYQLSPLKQRALEACRSPMNFVMTRWRGGRAGRLLMGFDYGFFCTKCCWAFMAVLVVVGGMNLLWMGLFAGVIFVEKIAPRGKAVSKGLGVLLLAAGTVIAVISL